MGEGGRQRERADRYVLFSSNLHQKKPCNSLMSTPVANSAIQRKIHHCHLKNIVIDHVNNFTSNVHLFSLLRLSRLLELVISVGKHHMTLLLLLYQCFNI